MFEEICKGGCGNKPSYKGWCKIKWRSGNRFAVGCPNIEKKRGKSISITRLEESKLGKNPMQNSLISTKNHSPQRNRKASESLKELGRLGLLPQQIESYELKEKRKKNVSRTLRKLFEDGKHPRQLETVEKRRKRLDKMASTLIKLGKQKKLPVQNMTENQRKIFGDKISKKLREGIESGRIKLSKSWKRISYKNLILRSEWEKIVAEFLDKNKITWEYETKRIPYWDSERKFKAITIPDFYIPSSSLFIEVKNDFRSNLQQTKDKIEGIKSKGFKIILIGKEEIRLIKESPVKILNILKEAK